jgi:hypothetical protein
MEGESGTLWLGTHHYISQRREKHTYMQPKWFMQLITRHQHLGVALISAVVLRGP